MNRLRDRSDLRFAVLALVTAAAVWFVLPHDREVKSLPILLLKLVPFVLATEAISRLDVSPEMRTRWASVLVPVTFLVYFVYFVPEIFIYADDSSPDSFYGLYYSILTLTPLIILSLAVAFRVGGGSSSTVRRLAYGMLLLMLSGLEDLAFLTLGGHLSPPPEEWTWASHMTVFIGHPPTTSQALVFIAVHVLLSLLVLFAPQRWWGQLSSSSWSRLRQRGVA